MGVRYVGLIEMGFTLVVVFGFGFWQLRSVTKSIADGDEAKEDAPSGAPGHAIRKHPLDGR